MEENGDRHNYFLKSQKPALSSTPIKLNPIVLNHHIHTCIIDNMIIGRLLANRHILLAAVIFGIFFSLSFQNVYAESIAGEPCLSISEENLEFLKHLENQCITHSTDCHRFAQDASKKPNANNLKSTNPNEGTVEAICERIKHTEAVPQCLGTDPSMLENFPFDCLRYESDCLVYHTATTNSSDCFAHFAVSRGDIDYCDILHPYNPSLCKFAYAVITRDRNLCDQFEKSEYCYSKISDLEIKKCTDIENYAEKRDCIFNISALYKTTFHCRTLLINFDDRLKCIINVASTNNDPSQCSYKNDVHGKASYICSETMCEKFESQEEKAACYLNNLGTVPTLNLCSFLGKTHVQDKCYDSIASFGEAGDYFKIGVMDRRKACSLISDFKERKLCKFYSGIFPDRTIFRISFGLILVFALFYYFISVYTRRLKSRPSKKLLIICGILLGIAQLFLMSFLFVVPVIGIFTDHIFMIVKILCPPDGSGNCVSGGWLSFITLKGIFVYFLMFPLINAVLAILALKLNLLFSRKNKMKGNRRPSKN